MQKKVGIPRALFFYEYYPLWKTFFEELGAEVVPSDRTVKRILDNGVKSCVDEACVPVKLYFGHVQNLKDRVDYLFIPRLTSVSKGEYICPKFGGLPDMVRHNIEGLPEIIDVEVNYRKSRESEMETVYSIGRYFTGNRTLIREAYEKSMMEYSKFKNRARKGALPSEIIDNSHVVRCRNRGGKFNIGIIGHVYNLYDEYVNMNLIYKIRDYGANVTTIEMLSDYDIYDRASTLPKKMFWYFGRKAMGAALDFIEKDNLDGLIYVMSFGCGVDAFVCDLIEKRIRNESKIPFIVLTLDEHSGEVGLDTRIEAFMDMICRKVV